MDGVGVPEGRRRLAPGFTPGGAGRVKISSPGGALADFDSPEIPFVESDIMPLKKPSKLVFEAYLSMMLRLPLDVFGDSREV